MKKSILVSLGVSVVLLALVAVHAQDRASMSAPIIRSSEGNLVFSVSLEGLSEGKSYRIGFGAASAAAPTCDITITANDVAMGLSPSDFVQGNTNAWWGVKEVQARGFVIGPSSVPGSVRFTATIPQEDANSLGKVFLFVSRDYGTDRWYLEDGTVVEESDW